MVDLGAALSAASGAPSWAASSADVATLTRHYTCTEVRERREASFCFECNEAKSYCSCILWSVCCHYRWYYTQKGKKNKIISWFVILPDFQHYYEVDCSNLIQSKTIWWQKIMIFQIHMTAQPQQNTTGRRRGSSFTWGLSSPETSKAYHKNRRDSISKPVAAPFSSQIATSSLQQSNWNDEHLFCHNLCIYPLFPKSRNTVLP